MKIGVRLGAALGLSALLALLPRSAWAGGGGGGGGGLCKAFSEGETLVMRDNCFDGVAHFVGRGATLSVENQGQFPHSFTAVDGTFDTGVLSPGQVAEIQLGGEGIVRVVCTLHGSAHGAGMAGVLLVGNPKTLASEANAGRSAEAITDGQPLQSGGDALAARLFPVAATLVGAGGLIALFLLVLGRRHPAPGAAKEL